MLLTQHKNCEMRRFLKVLLCALILAFTFQARLDAQGQIQTKKYRLSSFTASTLKVVTGSAPMLDGVIMDGMTSQWRISPYEFCTVQEYEKLSKDPRYYFLTVAKSQGLTMLCVARGGIAGDSNPAKDSFEVISVPVASEDSPSGREVTFIPAVLDIIQDYIEAAMTSETAGLSGLAAVAKGGSRLAQMALCVCEDDLSEQVTQAMKDELQAKGVLIFDAESADALFASGRESTLVTWTVAPSTPGKGAYCYKALIDAGTHELCYFQRHALKSAADAGLLPSDLKKITSGRKKR